MKHSKHIALMLLGAVSAVTLTACDDDDTPREGQPIYESVEQCRTSNASNCDQLYARALSNHIASGPRYTSQEQCLAQGHERCSNVGAGVTDVWLPAMVGFMVGRAMENTRPIYLQGYPNPTTQREIEDRQVVAGGGSRGGSPVFVGSFHGGGMSYSPGSLGSGMSAGAARSGVSVAAPAAGRGAVAAPSAAARGGFGASGHGMSAGG